MDISADNQRMGGRSFRHPSACLQADRLLVEGRKSRKRLTCAEIVLYSIKSRDSVLRFVAMLAKNLFLASCPHSSLRSLRRRYLPSCQSDSPSRFPIHYRSR